MPQGIQVPYGADGAGGAGPGAHRLSCSVHLQLGAGALSAVLPAARPRQALGGAIVELTQLKQMELWLYDFDSQMLQQGLADLRRAYLNFFERRAKFPRFKKK